MSTEDTKCEKIKGLIKKINIYDELTKTVKNFNELQAISSEEMINSF